MIIPFDISGEILDIAKLLSPLELILKFKTGLDSTQMERTNNFTFKLLLVLLFYLQLSYNTEKKQVSHFTSEYGAINSSRNICNTLKYFLRSYHTCGISDI